MAQYDEAFFRYVNSSGIASADAVIPVVQQYIPATSVLDVGCGQGAWLKMWSDHGVGEVVGLDGDYVNRNALLISADAFQARDLTKPFDLGRRFDLVQSLEVAEHLPNARAESFVADLARHGDAVLFSAAPPGQGGDYHINEQDYEFWRAQFKKCGYSPCDVVRPAVAGKPDVEPWYRYNSFLYVNDERLADYAELASRRVPDETPLADISPLPYQIRKRMIAMLPVPAVTTIAKVKERIVGQMRGARHG